MQQGAAYYIYAGATDAASGVASMTANVGNLTTGQTAVPLVAGVYNVFGTTYAFRSAALTASTGTSGAKSCTVTATDYVANATTSGTLSVTVDNAAPSGAITAPLGGYAAASTVVTSNSADTTAGVYSAQFQYRPSGSGAWTPIGTATTSPYRATWNTTGLVEGGRYDLQVVTTDNAMIVFTSPTVTVVIDRTAPAAPSPPVLSAASDAGVPGDNLTSVLTPTLTGTAEAGHTVKVYDGAVLVGSATAPGETYSVTTSALADGVHSLTAAATDIAGNVSASSGATVVTIDAVRPTAIDGTLANGGTIDAGDTLSATYSEPMISSSFCSAWTSNSVTQTLNDATVTVTNSGSSDSFSVSTPSCTFHFGSVVVGDYVSATSTFASSSVSWNPTTRTLTITVGTFGTGGRKSGTTAIAPSYTPDGSLSDYAGNLMATTALTAVTPSRF